MARLLLFHSKKLTLSLSFDNDCHFLNSLLELGTLSFKSGKLFTLLLKSGELATFSFKIMDFDFFIQNWLDGHFLIQNCQARYTFSLKNGNLATFSFKKDNLANFYLKNTNFLLLYLKLGKLATFSFKKVDLVTFIRNSPFYDFLNRNRRGCYFSFKLANVVLFHSRMSTLTRNWIVSFLIRNCWARIFFHSKEAISPFFHSKVEILLLFLFKKKSISPVFYLKRLSTSLFNGWQTCYIFIQKCQLCHFYLKLTSSTLFDSRMSILLLSHPKMESSVLCHSIVVKSQLFH